MTQTTNRAKRIPRQNRRPPTSGPKVEYFVGLLYPARRILKAWGGELPSAAVEAHVQMVSDPSFWEDVETGSDTIPARTLGRLVEIATETTHQSLATGLAIATIGMCDSKFIWIKAEEPEVKPSVPDGKKLDFAVNMVIHVLHATTVREARRLFANEMEIGLAANKMWLLQGHEARALIKTFRSGQSA